MERYTQRDMDAGTFIRDDFYEPDHIKHWGKDSSGRRVVDDEFDCVNGDAADRLAAYEDTDKTPDEIQQALADLARYRKAEQEGRMVVLPCKVGELIDKYEKLTKPTGDEAETYTTGYRNGHKNGQAELIAYLLRLDTGTRAEAEAALAKKGE